MVADIILSIQVVFSALIFGIVLGIILFLLTLPKH